MGGDGRIELEAVFAFGALILAKSDCVGSYEFEEPLWLADDQCMLAVSALDPTVVRVDWVAPEPAMGMRRLVNHSFRASPGHLVLETAEMRLLDIEGVGEGLPISFELFVEDEADGRPSEVWIRLCVDEPFRWTSAVPESQASWLGESPYIGESRR